MFYNHSLQYQSIVNGRATGMSSSVEIYLTLCRRAPALHPVDYGFAQGQVCYTIIGWVT